MVDYKRGQIVELVEKPGYMDGITRGKTYVVNAISRHHGTSYLTILGDDERAHELLHTMFQPAQQS